jgi:tetratricopeptide (TPR) repeat protein
MRIFISYRREDSSGHAGRLFDALQSRFGRGQVFMDVSGIVSGENFVAAIDQAVRTCDALVAVIGDEWLSCTVGNQRRLDMPDDFVRTEIATALERGIPVVPVLVERTTMPSVEALPASLKPLATRNAHELTDARWSYDVERLIASLETLGGKRRSGARWRWLAAAAVLAVVAAVGIVVYNQSGAEDLDASGVAALAARATEALGEGRYDEAIRDLDRVLLTEPRADHYYNRGFAHFSKSDVDLALADWNSALALDPRDARTYRQRGSAYFSKGDYNRAIADFDRAIALEPAEPRAYYNRGLVFKARGEVARAAADFTAAVKIDGDPAVTTEARTQLEGLAAPGAASSTEPVAETAPRLPPAANLAGEWTADVKYSWGDTHPERFSFKVDGGEVLGTASFLRVRRGILDGTLTGNRIRFRTETQEILGAETRDLTHHYRGTISGDEIVFYMQTVGGSASEPIEFTARRVTPARDTGEQP